MKSKKKLKLREEVKTFLGVAFLYILIIVFVILLDDRMAQINENNKTTQQNEIVEKVNK